MNTKVCRKVCLNCGSDWEMCGGVGCQSLDGACGCDFNPNDIKPFWYKCVGGE